jgi:demethylmenaquinone methyltransferase/2-methoxy-6-polyprenyl-1,4-benzoquinol methylase
MTDDQFTFRSSEEKKTYVRSMFTQIAGRYDLLNHLLSFGLDYGWRKTAIRLIGDHCKAIDAPCILDIACGTGDLSFEAIRQIPNAKITGIDLSKGMLDIFQKKIEERKVNIICFEGDVEALRFADAFDAAMIGFGTRNFTRLDVAFAEICRVLKPGGIFVNLELSRPRRAPMKQSYNFYSKRILPLIGKVISSSSAAYSYLPDSIERFPEREEIIKMLHGAGFTKTYWKDLSAGIVTMHVGIKQR